MISETFFLLTILFDLDIVHNLCWSWSCGFFNCKFEEFEKSKKIISFFLLVLGCWYTINCWRKTTWNQCWRSCICIAYALYRYCLYIYLYSCIIGSTWIRIGLTTMIYILYLYYRICFTLISLSSIYLFCLLWFWYSPFFFLYKIWKATHIFNHA